MQDVFDVVLYSFLLPIWLLLNIWASALALLVIAFVRRHRIRLIVVGAILHVVAAIALHIWIDLTVSDSIDRLHASVIPWSLNVPALLYFLLVFAVPSRRRKVDV